MRLTKVVLPCGLTCLLAATAMADPFSFSGTFPQDDKVALFEFRVSTPGAVTLETYSFGGGTNDLGQAVPSGGFDTVLSLYSDSGSLINYTVTWSCPPGNIDPASALGCGDAFLNPILSAGNYILALTEYFNIPNGLHLSDGFFESGAGNFTGPLLCGVPGGFYDAACDQRNGKFEVDIVGTGVKAASPVPEPDSIALLGLAVLACAKRLWPRTALSKR